MRLRLAFLLFWTTLTAFYGGSAAGQITSDRDPHLAINAWDGAQHGTVLRLHDGCRPDNPDCVWHWVHGMIVSDRDPHLAINAWDGAQHGTVLRLHEGCQPDTPDCTWQAQYVSMTLRTEADRPGRGNTVTIDGFTLPPTDWYPPGWCFWGTEAEARFGRPEATPLGEVIIECLPPRGMTVVAGPTGGGTSDGRPRPQPSVPSPADATAFATQKLDEVMLPDYERSFFIYSKKNVLGRTQGKTFTPDEGGAFAWPDSNEMPEGELMVWGVGHTHFCQKDDRRCPSGPRASLDRKDFYNPKTGESSFKQDARTAVENNTTVWIRLTQGETIRIDPRTRFIYPERGPTLTGAKRIVEMPIPLGHITDPQKGKGVLLIPPSSPGHDNADTSTGDTKTRVRGSPRP